MKITISGTPGSGKSTVGKAIAEEFGLKHFSTGDFMRALAEKKGVSLRQLSGLAEKDPVIDHKIDEYSESLGRTEDDFVMDSRLAFHFIPDSLKVFLKCDTVVAAGRIYGDVVAERRSQEKDIRSREDAILAVKERMRSERERYLKYYDIDIDDESNYDIVIDTSSLSQDESISTAIGKIRERLCRKS